MHRVSQDTLVGDQVAVSLEHPITVVLLDTATRRAVDRQTITACQLRHHLLSTAIRWHGFERDGVVFWKNPQTGERYPHGLEFHFFISHPDTGEMVEVDPVACDSQ